MYEMSNLSWQFAFWEAERGNLTDRREMTNYGNSVQLCTHLAPGEVSLLLSTILLRANNVIV